MRDCGGAALAALSMSSSPPSTACLPAAPRDLLLSDSVVDGGRGRFADPGVGLAPLTKGFALSSAEPLSSELELPAAPRRFGDGGGTT